MNEWAYKFTAKRPTLTVVVVQEWDNRDADEPGIEHDVFRAGEWVRDESSINGLVPTNLRELLTQAREAIAALNRAAEGDSNDVEIEAGRRVADVLEALVKGLRQ